MGVFGDMGTAEVDGTLDAGHTEEIPSLRTVEHLKEQLGELFGRDARQEPPLSLILHIGDLSYARGYDAQWDEVSRFRQFLQFRQSFVDFVCHIPLDLRPSDENPHGVYSWKRS